MSDFWSKILKSSSDSGKLLEEETASRVEGKTLVTRVTIPKDGGQIQILLENGEERVIDAPYTRPIVYDLSSGSLFTFSLVALHQQNQIEELNKKVDQLNKIVQSFVHERMLAQTNKEFLDNLR